MTKTTAILNFTKRVLLLIVAAAAIVSFMFNHFELGLLLLVLVLAVSIHNMIDDNIRIKNETRELKEKIDTLDFFETDIIKRTEGIVMNVSKRIDDINNIVETLKNLLPQEPVVKKRSNNARVRASTRKTARGKTGSGNALVGNPFHVSAGDKLVTISQAYNILGCRRTTFFGLRRKYKSFPHPVGKKNRYDLYSRKELLNFWINVLKK